MRVLVGHESAEFSGVVDGQYDVRCVQQNRNGVRPSSIAEMLEQCPPAWKPDVYLHSGTVHFPVPTDVETFEGLTVTVISDWHRGGRAVWAGAGFFDLVVGERPACELIRSLGFDNAVFARLWSADPALHRVLPETKKDIDVLFIGSLDPSVWNERNRWLARLGRLSAKHRIVITQGHYGEEYVRLTNRAKIVFNRSVNGCTNQRAYDGLACGALVFNDAEAEEPKEAFRDRVHCVYYDDGNFESLIDYYLTHDAERQAIVEAGRRLVLANHTNAAHTAAMYRQIEAHRDREGYRPYAELPEAERCCRKAMQIYAVGDANNGTMALRLLDRAEQLGYAQSGIAQARAAVHGWIAGKMMPLNEEAGRLRRANFDTAVMFARQAARQDPGSVTNYTGLAFLLLERAEIEGDALSTSATDTAEAVEILIGIAEYCEKAARGEERTNHGELDGFVFPHRTDAFDRMVDAAYLRREADHARWEKILRAAIAWRCRMQLSDLAIASGNPDDACAHARKAVETLPDSANARLMLARCCLHLGKADEAVEQFRGCFRLEPLLVEAWPEHIEALLACGKRADAEAFAQDCRLLMKAMAPIQEMEPRLAQALQAG